MQVLLSELAIIDGNTRAYVATQRGELRIEAHIQNLDQIDDCADLYVKLHKLGPSVGVASIGDLSERILEPQEYQEKWIEFCERLLSSP